MKNLKKWWTSKDKLGKINFFMALAFWLAAAVFVVLMSLSGILFPNAGLERIFVLNKPFESTWEGTWPRLVGMVYYFCVLWGVSMVVRFLLSHLFVTSKKAATVVKLITSFIKYAVAIAIILIWVALWGVDTGALLVSAGIIALIIGLGAQSLISDIIAGLNIVFEDEYKVGDIVVVDDFRGTIQEIGLTTTKIMDPAGNVKIINNSQISTVVNLSDHPSVAACLMYIDYDEDLVKIEKLIEDNAAEIKKQLPFALDAPKYIGVSALQDGYIELKMICHCKEENRFQTERDMNRAYCLLFLNSGVDYPYNQLVIGSRALTHPQDAANPEQLKKILAHLAGEDVTKGPDEKKD
jgi:small-conductance mechanosensitive channel